MLVGEQPGDREDLEARPFVGPAGTLLEQLLHEAGLEREGVYLTNAVKHFKWAPRGKRRLHRRPNAEEVAACRVWLELELAVLKPRVVVALGATAVTALLRVTASIESLRRRQLYLPSRVRVFATYHPSAILRARSVGGDDRLRMALLSDLRRVAAAARVVDGS